MAQAALTAQAAASAPAPATPASAPGTPAKPTTYAAVMSKIETPVKEPPKGWVADPDERQSILAQRKLFMLQQARRCVWRCAAAWRMALPLTLRRTRARPCC